MDKCEYHVARAEIAWKSGNVMQSIQNAKQALKYADTRGKTVALKIFIAKAYSKLENFKESNEIYRGLIDENVYLPPVIMGLLYNNTKAEKSEKVRSNIKLMKIFVG